VPKIPFFLSKALVIVFANFLSHIQPNEHPLGCLTQHSSWNKCPINHGYCFFLYFLLLHGIFAWAITRSRVYIVDEIEFSSVSIKGMVQGCYSLFNPLSIVPHLERFATMRLMRASYHPHTIVSSSFNVFRVTLKLPSYPT